MNTLAQFVEFEGDGGTIAKITVQVINAADINAYVEMLDSMGFLFTWIDGDSLEAYYEGSYDKTWEVMCMLERDGFRWCLR